MVSNGANFEQTTRTGLINISREQSREYTMINTQRVIFATLCFMVFKLMFLMLAPSVCMYGCTYVCIYE